MHGDMPGPVRSVSQAFAILRLAAARPQGLTLSEFARAMSLSPSSCLNLLRTLVAEGALERARDDRRYRLVESWNPVSTAPGRVEQMLRRARVPLRKFAEAHQCTVGLWQIISPRRLALVALGNSEASTRIHMAIGQRQPVGNGSIGRALAAQDQVDEAELQRRYGELRWQQPLSFSDYAEQVARAGAMGFGIDDGYAHGGICSVGTTVPGTTSPRFCLSASIFANSRTIDGVEALGHALVELGRDLAGD